MRRLLPLRDTGAGAWLRARHESQRPLSRVPKSVFALLAVTAVAQGTWHLWQPAPRALLAPLPAPPAEASLRVASFGEPAAAARVLMLWLQAADSQAGGSLPLASLDYGRVRGWLQGILGLDPSLSHPLLSASRVYALVREPERQRLMLDFVHEAFLERPDERWPWLAHAAVVARHQLKDEALALRYATSLSRHATGPGVPNWARDMALLFHADLGEVETAKVLLGGLIEAGRLTDAHELWFLQQRLQEAEGVGPSSQ